jgi:hypothetical protein
MEEKTEISVIIVLMFIYTIYAGFAFKIHDSLFNMTRPTSYSISSESKVYYLHGEYDWLKHQEIQAGNLLKRTLNAGVCQLGKFGAWILFIWSLLMFILLLVYMKKEKNVKNNIYKVIGIINIVLSIIYGIMTFMLNTPLFYRCIPYLVFQVSVSIWLIVISRR